MSDKALLDSINGLAKEMTLSRQKDNLSGNQKIEVREIAEKEVEPVQEEIKDLRESVNDMRVDITAINSSSKTTSKFVIIVFPVVSTIGLAVLGWIVTILTTISQKP